MSQRENKDGNRRRLSVVELRAKFGLEDAAESLLLLVNGDPRRLPAHGELDTKKADIRDQCQSAMRSATGPFMAPLKQVPIDLKDIYIAIERPEEIVAHLRRRLRVMKREAKRVLQKLEEDKKGKTNQMKGLMATWRPSRPYQRTNRVKLGRRTLELGAMEVLVNGAMLYTASYKGGLLAAVMASVLPAAINLGGGAFLGDILLRHIRRENANGIARVLSWKGICALLSLVCSVNVGFAYLRVTGSVEGLLQYLLTGKLDYSVPAIAGVGLLLFAWSSLKWWYSAHPNLQIEKLGRGLDELNIQINRTTANLDKEATAAVRRAGVEIELAEDAEGDDVSIANARYGELVLLISRLQQEMDEIQKQHEEPINDYNRMIFDALGPQVPAHYQEVADLSATRPGMPDVSSLKTVLAQLEHDFRCLREKASHARRELELEPERTLGWHDEVDDTPALPGSVGPSGSAVGRAAASLDATADDSDPETNIKHLPDIVRRRDAAEQDHE